MNAVATGATAFHAFLKHAAMIGRKTWEQDLCDCGRAGHMPVWPVRMTNDMTAYRGIGPPFL